MVTVFLKTFVASLVFPNANTIYFNSTIYIEQQKLDDESELKNKCRHHINNNILPNVIRRASHVTEHTSTKK